jgi:hypothetical protein
VFVAAVMYWATLSGPAHAQLLAESALPGVDSRSFVVASDRSPGLQTIERRHDASAEGHPTPPMPGCIAATSIACCGLRLIRLSLDAQAATQPHSLAQPRAPPADPQALTD